MLYLVVVMFDHLSFRFVLVDDLLCLALNISVDGCCNRSRCGGCVVEWSSKEGVVSSCATRIASVEVGLEGLMGINIEKLRVMLFLVFCMGRTCADLAGVGVFEHVGGDVVVHSSI